MTNDDRVKLIFDECVFLENKSKNNVIAFMNYNTLCKLLNGNLSTNWKAEHYTNHIAIWLFRVEVNSNLKPFLFQKDNQYLALSKYAIPYGVSNPYHYYFNYLLGLDNNLQLGKVKIKVWSNDLNDWAN